MKKHRIITIILVIVLAIVCAITIISCNFGSNTDDIIDGDKNTDANIPSLKFVDGTELLSFTLLDSGTYEVTGFTGSPVAIIIPNTYKGKKVTSIGECAFMGLLSLKGVKIGANVETIKDSAFYACVELRYVELPDSLKVIERSAFNFCGGLFSITIPKDVTEIAENAFFNLSEIYNLSKINITKGEGIALNAKDVYTSVSKKSKLSVEDGFVLHKGDITSLVRYIGEESEIIIPDSIEELGTGAFFANRTLNKVIIPDSVKTLGLQTFYLCENLFSVTIGNNVASLENVFGGCSKLVEIYNLSGQEIDMESADFGSELTEIYTTKTTKSRLNIDDKGYVIVQEGNEKHLIDYVGDNYMLSVPEGVTNIYSFAFYSEFSSFEGEHLTMNNISSIILPNSVKTIGEYALGWCDTLERITIGSNLESIGRGALFNCENLEHIYYDGLLDDWNNIEKGEEWDAYLGEYTLHLRDGQEIKMQGSGDIEDDGDEEDSEEDESQGSDNTTTEIITTLPDLLNYGASSAYYTDGTIGYSISDVNRWVGVLSSKQNDIRAKWMPSGNADDWPNDTTSLREFYVSFGSIARSIDSNGEIVLQNAIGYFDEEGNWVNDEDASTLERILCYASLKDVIARLDKARVDSDKVEAIVDYITRDDGAYKLNAGEKRSKDNYELRIGYASILEDIDQIKELGIILDDFDEYECDVSYSSPRFESEEEVQDYINRKKRKIFGEVFTAFGEDGDQFARLLIQLISYSIEVVDDIMIPAYNNHVNNGTKISFEDYVRYEMFDHEALSYFLTFMDDNVTNFNMTTYEATNKKTLMSLFGYYYQFFRNSYLVFDDTRMVENMRLGNVTEYEDFLELSHKEYFNTNAEVLRYRDYLLRQYEKGYRYSDDFYKKMYETQVAVLSIKEEKDLEVYVGGAGAIGNSVNEGQYQNGLTTVANDITYSSEILDGLDLGLESVLKLMDVLWVYCKYDNNMLKFNAKAKDWNSLTADQQELKHTKIKKVGYELVQLEAIDYIINHKTITEANLTRAIQLMIYYYSADSVLNIQECKKDEVIYCLELDRFLSAVPYDLEQIQAGAEIVPDHVIIAYKKLKELVFRNYVKCMNLDANYTVGVAREQLIQANNADWRGIKGNVKDTLAIDFGKYYASDASIKHVDQYFEDTIIRKVMSCGATMEEPCLNGNGHMYCEEEYDTDWALSRFLNTHEVVFDYLLGNTTVTFLEIDEHNFLDPTKFYENVESMPNGGTITSSQSKAENAYKITYHGYGLEDVKLYAGNEIGEVCAERNSNWEYPLVGTASKYWKNVPIYEGSSHWLECDANGRITIIIEDTKYIYTFIGWYVDERFEYPVLLEENYEYNIRLYPAYRLEKVSD